ncbi:MAG: universal stress protein family [uncultured archaeon A07HR60]|nr:MAG: universal stress protein family [uncultured archaeon A07HR60]
MKYVVATDGSPQSDEAVRHATSHALAFDATLELVNVITPGTGTVEGKPIFEGEDVAADDGRRILDRARDVARDASTDEAMRAMEDPPCPK